MADPQEAALQEVAVKVLSDAAYAKKLLSDPEGTLRAEGIAPTAEMLEALAGIDDAALKELAQDFQERGMAA